MKKQHWSHEISKPMLLQPGEESLRGGTAQYIGSNPGKQPKEPSIKEAIYRRSEFRGFRPNR